MNEKLVLNSLTGKMFEPVPMKIYQEIWIYIKTRLWKEKPHLRGYILNWYSEYGEWNHEKMTEIVTILDECTQEDVDEMRGYLRDQQTHEKLGGEEKLGRMIEINDEKAKKLRDKLRRIRNIGQEIHNRRGFTAMQANFYIFFNLLIPHDPAERAVKFRDLKYLWDGIGDWEE